MKRFLELLRRSSSAGESDFALLERFRLSRDEGAFEELLRRHGPLVWGICRRGLVSVADAEDAFQAVFVVLIQRAAKVPRDRPLGAWLCRTAVWTVNNHRRRLRLRQVTEYPSEPVAAEVSSQFEVYELLAGLPEKYRTPIVLCHLQGWTRQEAAAELGLTEGTLSAILHRGLTRLRARFATDPVPPLAVLAISTLPANLPAQTFQSVAAYLLSSGLSPAVLELSQGVLRMFWIKKVITTVMLTVGIGVGLLGWSLTPGTNNAAIAQAPKEPEKPLKPTDAAELEKLQANQAAAIQALLVARIQVEQKKIELYRAEQLLEASTRMIEALRAAEADRKQTDDRIELHAFDAGGLSGNFTYLEFQAGEQVTHATLYKAEDIAVILKRTLADPKAPKRIKVVAGMAGRKPAENEMLTVAVQLVKVLRAIGVTEVYYQGHVVTQYSFIEGESGPSSQKTKYLDGTQPVPLAKHFSNNLIDTFLPQKSRWHSPEEIVNFNKRVLFTRATPDSKGRLEVSVEKGVRFKVGDMLPVYRRHAKSDGLLDVGHVNVVEILGETVLVQARYKDQEASFLKTDLLGPPINRDMSGK
ncbi:MAG: RNA polymerase sigma factor [Fimbriiglobus sp.]